MPRCVVCNRRIPKKDYFCGECMKEQAGNSRRQTGFEILSWLLSLPFQTVSFPTHWAVDEEKMQWVVHRADKITTRFPEIPTAYVVDQLCTRVDLTGDSIREQVIIELRSIQAEKDGPLWAPWDVVLQPGIHVLILVASALGLVLFVLSL